MLPAYNSSVVGDEPSNSVVKLMRRAGWLWLLAVIGAGLRLFALTTVPGLNADEAYHGWLAAQLLDHTLIDRWRTPSGNFINPLNFLPQLVLLAVCKPAFWIAKAPVAVANLAMLWGAYRFGTRHLNPEAARVWLASVALCPVLVMYARIGWDPSLLPPVTVLLLWCAWEQRLWACVVVFGIGVVCHPTFVFIAPVVVGLCVTGTRDVLQVFRVRQRAVSVLMGLATLCVCAALVMPSTRALLLGDPAHVFALEQWLLFARASADFLVGTTSLRYLTGHPVVFGPALAVWAVLALGAIVWMTRDAVVDVRRERGLRLSLGIALAIFFVRAGPAGFAQGTERYGLWLVVPTLLWLALRVGALPARLRHAVTVGTSAIAVAMLVQCYFAWTYHTGGRAHRTFSAGQTEPKQAAYDAIVAFGKRCGSDVHVIAEDYWLQVPIAMLAGRSRAPAVHVTRLSDAQRDAALGAEGWARSAFVLHHASPAYAGILGEDIARTDIAIANFAGDVVVDVLLPPCPPH